MASSKPGGDGAAASTAMAVLLDDMGTNLSATQTSLGKSNPGQFITQCLQESLDNINEYLHFQHGKKKISMQSVYTSLAVMQYFEGNLGYIVMAGFSCLLFRQDKLNLLASTSRVIPCILGENPVFEGQVQSKVVQQGDILVMAQTSDIDAIGIDYLRTTLSRFPDSTEMALRQINTRTNRHSTSSELGIVLARVDELAGQKRSWLDKFRKS